MKLFSLVHSVYYTLCVTLNTVTVCTTVYLFKMFSKYFENFIFQVTKRNLNSKGIAVQTPVKFEMFSNVLTNTFYWNSFHSHSVCMMHRMCESLWQSLTFWITQIGNHSNWESHSQYVVRLIGSHRAFPILNSPAFASHFNILNFKTNSEDFDWLSADSADFSQPESLKVARQRIRRSAIAGNNHNFICC